MSATTSSLLVIYTGGTLGMMESESGLVPGPDFEGRLRRALQALPAARRDALPDFTWMQTEPAIDSSAATPADWQRLGHLIAAHYSAYQGVLILHGTDTLAWTASSLAYQLQGIHCPVIISGAMDPLEREGSDALGNIETAMRFAIRPDLAEVALCFNGQLLRGVRSRKWQTRHADAFTSPNHPPLGAFIDNQAIIYPGRGLTDHQRGAPRFELPDYGSLSAGGVPRVALWPGISAWQLEAWLLDDRVRGALLEVWGGGNVPEDPAILGVLARASGEGKLLAAISQCPQGGISLGHYAAGQGLVDAGVLSGDDMTPEAAVTKLVHLLAQPLDDAERRRRFLTPLVGERSAPLVEV
ncbi:asparaginase [Halomonas halmophila]|uniref:L-asparaginase 1 n=1 Tax=Halomonas halmophila TaxID=252 RepID=A0A4Y4F589_9GAMM|nr:asparaginase [Halomonas halmophila]GED22760.1 L-asparaginase 1 [Halomonas halmophila]